MSQPAPDPAPSVVATIPLASPPSTASAVPHNLTAAAPEHPRNASALPPGMPTQAGPTISLNLQTLRGVVQSLERLEDRVDQLDVQGRQAAEKSNGENLRREKWLLSQIKTLEHQHALVCARVAYLEEMLNT